MSKWMTQDWTTGQLNALVKNIGEANARAIIAGKAKVSVVMESVMTLVTTFIFQAQPRFVARDHFKVDTSDKAEVKIAFIWDDFQSHFLGKIEEAVVEVELAVRSLDKDLLDKDIRAELGEEKEETTLAQFWALLKAQDHGQSGPLLTNGYANIFYIRDAKSTLWAVNANWNADNGGWNVNANSVTNPNRWNAGNQVVSRNYDVSPPILLRRSFV